MRKDDLQPIERRSMKDYDEAGGSDFKMMSWSLTEMMHGRGENKNEKSLFGV